MATATHAGSPLPHELSPVEIVAQFGSSLDQGLASSEAQSRLALWGPNSLPEKPGKSIWLSFLQQFRDVQVYLLLAAAGVSSFVWAYEGAAGPPYESITILAIVLLNAVFGFLQEERAGRALRALRSMTPAECTVIRNGELQRVAVRSLVPGDLLVISEGDRIAADGRLVEVTSFHTQEAALTGESFSVSKSLEPLPPDAALADRSNVVHSGTIAVAGHAKAIVTATGRHTEFGRIAQLLDETVERETPLKQYLDRLGKRLGATILIIAAVTIVAVLVVKGANDPDQILRALIFGVALAVAATPEGLAAVVTVVLAVGVQRMARRGAIVRHLPAVETLGEVTVIASDKTGTMTLNQMTVNTIVTAAGTATMQSGSWTMPDGASIPQQMWDEVLLVLESAALANNARLQRSGDLWTPQGDPTESALLSAAATAGINLHELNLSYPREREFPFSSQGKRMSTLHRCTNPNSPGVFGRRVWITKGAPDVVLQHCSHETFSGSTRPLTSRRRAEIKDVIDHMASDALRTLAVATRAVPTGAEDQQSGDALESCLTLVGLIGMSDPPRPEARPAVLAAADAGVRSILITGDHEKTALAVARALGIDIESKALTGAQLTVLSDGELAEALRHVSVFARVNPEHKLRIVKALQQNGEIVAMTGDGVNDAPALKAADIGIAMGITGTDVAKEAADLILTDDNFATIVAAIEEGRTIFSNIRKFLRYLLTTNFGEILTLVIGVLIAGTGQSGTHELILPLLAVQILWVNLVTDGAPALALGIDPPSPHVMHRAPFRAGGSIVDRAMIQDIAMVATIMASGTLWMFLHGTATEPIQHRRSLAFTTLILFQLFSAFQSRSSVTSGIAQLFRNNWLWVTVLATVALQVLVLQMPPIARAFAAESLSIIQWARCTLVASSAFWVMEVVKLIRRESLRRQRA
jgi:Ca2+-transporting ATPase